MKKLLLLTGLLFSLLLQAQDNAYLDKLKNISSQDEAISITKEALSAVPGLRLHKFKDFPNEHMFVVQYVPVNLTDEQIEEDKDNLKSQFAVFQFRYYNKGENKDLKIEGKKTYIFSDLRGEYLHLFSWWKKYFNPDADKVKVSENHSDRKLSYYFSGSNNEWKIRG